MDFLSLLIPFAYLGVLVTSLATFSSLYRKRKTKKYLSLAPYFAPHNPRNVYLSLLHLQDHDPSAPKVPQSVLRAALLARCTENIHRIIHVRTRKQALNTLLKKGSVGEEIWDRLLRAERELEAEVKDCATEANAYSPNWGSTIFQSANEMANNDLLKNRLEAITAALPSEKAAWDAKLASTREGFMRELEVGDKKSKKENEAGDRRSGAAAASSRTSAAKSKSPTAADVKANARSNSASASTTGSDEDAVLVERSRAQRTEPSSTSPNNNTNSQHDIDTTAAAAAAAASATSTTTPPKPNKATTST